jgi:hypothetical protein
MRAREPDGYHHDLLPVDSLSGRIEEAPDFGCDVATLALPVRPQAASLMPDLSDQTLKIIGVTVFFLGLGWSVYQMDKTFHD